jgi:pilus assembly protein CpaB
MDVKKVALLIGALLIAVVTAVMAKNMFSGAGASQAAAAPAVPLGPKVLVARKPLPVGSMIEPDSFSYQPWPKELIQGAYYTQGVPDGDPQKMVGMVVRNAVTAGQPLTRGTLVGPQDRGFLAAALGPGMRAVTVPVNQTSGVAGFVFPGDRVDMVLTQTVEGGGDGPALKVSETIVRNLRVLATDQAVDQTKDKDGKISVKPSATVTLEATPRIAEKIAVAQSVGQLSLALRSIADNTAELERAVASGQVKIAPGTNPAQVRQMLAVANQPIDTNTTFSTGGDVSRFQRRTVPTKPASASSQISQAMTGLGQALGSALGGAPAGPVVRVSRGNTVTVVPVGAR